MKNREMKNCASQRRPGAMGRGGFAAPLFWKRTGRLLSCLLVLSMLLNSFAFTIEDTAAADATPMSHVIDINGQEHAVEHAVIVSDGTELRAASGGGYRTEDERFLESWSWTAPVELESICGIRIGQTKILLPIGE